MTDFDIEMLERDNANMKYAIECYKRKIELLEEKIKDFIEEEKTKHERDEELEDEY